MLHVGGAQQVCTRIYMRGAHLSNAVLDVAYMFQKSNFKHVWPLKVLRAMASLLVTAGFVPAVGILTSPWSCGKMKVFNGDDFDCGGSHRVGFVLMSVLALVFYLPFGLASSLVFHE